MGMKKNLKRITALGLAAVMVLSTAGCGSKTENETSQAAEVDPVTIKITWWGGQGRHDYTQKILDLYTESHPNVTFEAMPAGWDGYFDKLATQAASGSMPDIVQMDYLYIATYAKNDSLADLQPYMDDGTIDVSGIDEAVLDTGKIDGKMAGIVGATGMLAMGYNPDVFAEAGLDIPTKGWTWDDFISTVDTVKAKTGKFGFASGPVDDTNLFNYWVRQHGERLFSEDQKSIGYADDKIMSDYLTMWSDLMDRGAVPNPDEYAAIQTLGQESGPVVTGDAAMLQEWNNYANKVNSINDKISVTFMPTMADSDRKGLWNKPGYFWGIAENSKVKKEAAEFINWFINSEESNDIMLAERGVPSSSSVREYMKNSGKLNEQQKLMFDFVDEAMTLCGEAPAPDPIGMSEINEKFKNVAYSAFYGQMSTEEAAAAFRKEANEILARNN